MADDAYAALLDAAYRLGKRNANRTRGAHREAPLSGEWAGQMTPTALYARLDLDPETVDNLDGEFLQGLCESFEEGYEDVCQQAEDEDELYPRDDSPALDMPWWADR